MALRMSLAACMLAMVVFALPSRGVQRPATAGSPDLKIAVVPQPTESPRYLQDESVITRGSVMMARRAVEYRAETGILVVHVKDPLDDDAPPEHDDKAAAVPQPPEAGMSYVAYFRGEKEDSGRPITFVYNGGPGSATIWLHMGAFGPKRVVTADGGTHGPAAPYKVIDNEYSLLDVSDLVFIDAPGTGFGHLRGADKEKAFYGVDQDAHAFANFIVEFLSRHRRWNSPKYLFGESYGTTRSGVLAYILQNEQDLDLNGIILLSQGLNYDINVDQPQLNPGIDLGYALALPSYAATAWYHHKLPSQSGPLEQLLKEVESFAMSEYLQALSAGATLSAERKSAVAAKLHQYTGLPVDYLERADLRVNGPQFEKTLMGSDVTVGRYDSRYLGPTIDPMSREADYDPQSTALSSAYVSAFNDYVRGTLKFGDKKTYKHSVDLDKVWDWQHQPPGSQNKLPGHVNTMADLAVAMKQNPNLKMQLHGGYYDLATPYFAMEYELHHLPMQNALQANIEMHFYDSGHMVYAHEPNLKLLHANMAAFIEKTKSGDGK